MQPRLRAISEHSSTFLSTQTEFSVKKIDGVPYFLKTTFQFLRNRLFSRQTIVLRELPPARKAPQKRGLKSYTSTASSLLSLVNPVSRLARQASTAKVEQGQEWGLKQQEQQELQKPRPRLLKKAQPRELPEQSLSLEPVAPRGQPRLGRTDRRSQPVSSYSVSVFTVITLVIIEEDRFDFESEQVAQEQTEQFLLLLAMMMAFQQLAQAYMYEAYLYEQEAEAQARAQSHALSSHRQPQPAADADAEFAELSPDFFRAAFGNPLQLAPLRSLVPPNPQQFFAPPYYRPAAQPVSRPPLELPRNAQRLEEVGFPEDLIPEEFKCELRSMAMDNPVKMPGTGQICDGRSVLEALRNKPENPYNRQPMRIEDAKPDLVLRNQINGYVGAVVKGVEEKRKALGMSTLSQADYQDIHERALKACRPAQPTQAPAAPASVPETPASRGMGMRR